MEKAIPEREVERYLKNRVLGLGGLTFKFTSPGAIGIPDRIVLLRRRLAFVETKTIGGRLSPMQKWQHTRFAEHGFPVYVLWSKDEVDAFLQRWIG